MSKLRVALMIVASVIIVPASADARSAEHFAFRKFSQARFVDIGNRACGLHGNPRLCCAINDGVWHLFPRPPHCILM